MIVRCSSCGDEWIPGEGGRDGYCSSCHNPYHESGRVRGYQVDVECKVIEDFGRMLDMAMDAEMSRSNAGPASGRKEGER